MRRFPSVVFMMVMAASVAFASPSLAKIIPLEFVVDEQASNIRIDGEVIGIPLEGDQETAIGGTISIRALVKGSRAIGFIIDDSLLEQLDAIHLEVPNPIPFLPPLGEFDIRDLSLEASTAGMRFGPGLSFSTDTGRFEVLSGFAEGELLGDPLGPFDLAGNIQENVLIEGSMQLVGNEVRIEFPISQEFEIPDVPGTFYISGTVVAYAPIGG